MSLIKNGKNEIKNETVIDTLKDLANYADFGVSLLEGTWGKMDTDVSYEYIYTSASDIPEKRLKKNK